MTASGQQETKMVALNLFRYAPQSRHKHKKGLFYPQQQKFIKVAGLDRFVPLPDSHRL